MSDPMPGRCMRGASPAFPRRTQLATPSVRVPRFVRLVSRAIPESLFGKHRIILEMRRRTQRPRCARPKSQSPLQLARSTAVSAIIALNGASHAWPRSWQWDGISERCEARHVSGASSPRQLFKLRALRPVSLLSLTTLALSMPAAPEMRATSSSRNAVRDQDAPSRQRSNTYNLQG